MADIVNGGGKKEKKYKSSKSKSNKDSAKENTVCVEIDTVHQKKRKKVREVEVIHGNGKETNESSDVLQVDSTKRGKKRKNRSVSPEKNQGNHLVVDEPLAKSKAEKKKKAKKSCIEGKSDDLTQLIETNDYVKSKQKKHEEGSEVLHGDAIDKEPKSKDKKKKKKKNSSSEHLNTESIQNGESIPCDAKKESVVHENKEPLASHIENVMETKSKDKKKKKHKSTSEHLNTTEIIENDGSLSCDVKKENSNTNKSSPNEKNEMTPNEKNGMTPNKKNGMTSNEKNVTDSNCLSGSMTEKKQYSHETKSLPFQRVKIDEVKFADSRLKDNSYWAKGGADSGYGAKAQEVLGQVRGRDFRHEKTKKKRGSYRGGVIDLESHSIKFNYSDED